jgi:DNA repair protein RadC
LVHILFDRHKSLRIIEHVVANITKSSEPNPNEGHRKRLRERYERAGFAAFAEHEVLELLLTLCIPRRDVKQPAKKLLERFGNLHAVLDAPPEELRKVDGIGSVTPTALHIIRDASALYLQQGLSGRELFNSGFMAGEFLRMRFAGERTECVEILHLDSGRRLLPDGIERHEMGTVDQVLLTPRKVVESALRHGAKSIIIAHNHPGGSTAFSCADIEITWAVKAAAATVDIELADHFLIADDRVVSMRDEGLLDEEHEQVRMVAERQAPYGEKNRR